MARLLFVIIVVFVPGLGLSSGQSLGQARCSLTLDKSPAIRGIRLGMDARQLYILFPESGLDRRTVESAEGYPNYGVARLFFQPSAHPLTVLAARETFRNIDSMQLTLFDGRLTELNIEYAGHSSYPVRGPVWRNVDDLIAKLSEAFALPSANEWLERSQGLKILQCNGFTLAASIETGRGAIALRSTADYRDTITRRTAEDEERLRRAFKP